MRYQMQVLSDRLMHWQLIFLDQVRLRQKYHAPQILPDQGSNSWPQDHDSTFHVTETPAPGIIMCSYIHIICSIWCVIYNNYMLYDCGTHCSPCYVWSVKCMGIPVLYLYFCVLEPTIVVIIVRVISDLWLGVYIQNKVHEIMKLPMTLCVFSINRS